ncbi:hypothetical protein GP486_004211 [Trichoglossum hirsutum]|uniref:NACHT domain-containing protein n=1 Tax=Trichoglossum hirsutum TaxID=265104 RepID=A0A9P8RPI1_9PEZI|nr:hypothetical protein GP486_004211 [Trichoglossum hirsutum]
MAEAIAAFSLAANIVQFIDFGSNFASNVCKIYWSGRDGAGEIPDLRKITDDLQEVLKGLQLPAGNDGEIPGSERGIRQLAEQCQHVATELLNSLNKVSLPDKARKRDALKAAFKIIWKEEEIKSLQVRLEGFRHQLTLHLLASLRFASDQSRKSLDQQEMVLHQLGAVNEGTRKLEGMVNQVTTSTEGIGASVLDFITSNIKFLERTSERRNWQKDFIAAIYRDGENNVDREISAPSISEHREKSLQSAFVARLRYPGMEDREWRIADAYENTFQWIFEDHDLQEKRWSNFKEWLESDLQLYWITGKAGSGKSTLMKFICHEDASTNPPNPLDATIDLQPGCRDTSMKYNRQSRCEKYLRKWAADSRLITATFFFWNSGIDLQMSQKGLLLSLLFQILRQCPELIPFASPSRWEALCLFNDDPREWTEQELHQMLRFATDKLTNDMKLCLFVDGLDEFDGRHDDLICLFKDLIASPNVKVCVSSRPWVLFEDAFKHRPSLMLQNLTYPDIKHYATTNFQRDPSFAQLRSRESKYADQLVENIVSKACGVFLWVHLVVASLLAGMGYGDRVSDLQRRLDLLPPDLEKLYEKILQSLDPFYLEHAAQLFKLVQESRDPLPLLLLSFADEESPEFALNRPIQTISRDEMFLRADTMRRRLNSRCKGLLEVGSASTEFGDGEDTVQYLHRTVKDYIESADVQQRLGFAMKTSFDPHLRLCAGNLTHLKVINNIVNFLADGTFWTRVQRCLYSASRIQPMNRAFIVPLLDELDRSGSSLAKSISRHWGRWLSLETGRNEFINSLLEAGQWVPSHPLLSEGVIQYRFGSNFLSLVVRYGVVEYVEAKVNQGCLVQQVRNRIWPLLLDATYADSRWQIECHDAVPCLDMIACLLNKGADPNYLVPYRVGSVWVQILESILEDFDVTLKPPWAAIARLMIEHGAEVNKSVIDLLIMKRYNLPPRDWDSVGPFGTGWRELQLFRELSSIRRATARSWIPWLPWAQERIGS